MIVCLPTLFTKDKKRKKLYVDTISFYVSVLKNKDPLDEMELLTDHIDTIPQIAKLCAKQITDFFISVFDMLIPLFKKLYDQGVSDPILEGTLSFSILPLCVMLMQSRKKKKNNSPGW